MSLNCALTSDRASLLLFEEQALVVRRRREGDTVRRKSFQTSALRSNMSRLVGISRYP
jgi:hypothetical protein